MSVARRICLTLVLASVAPTMLADASARVPFRAELEPAGPVGIAGALHPEGRTVFQWPARASAEALVANASVRIIEREGVPQEARLLPGRPPSLGPARSDAEHRRRDATIFVDAAAPGAMVRAQAAAGDLVTVAARECEARAAVASGSSSAWGLRSNAGASEGLEASCDVASLTSVSPLTLSFVGVTLRVRHGDSPHDETFEAHAQGQGESGRSSIEVWVDHGRTSAPLEAGQRLTAQASSLRASGLLRLPRAMGHLTWGAVDVSSLPREFEVQGDFTIEPMGSDRVRIVGEASEPPSSPRARVDRRLGIGDMAGWTVAAMVSLALTAAWRPGTLFFALFTRLTQQDALQHPRRRLLLEHVAAVPGASVHDLARRAGISWKLARYHVLVLERHGLVAVRHFGRETAVFLPATPWSQQERLYLGRKPQVQLLIGAVRGSGTSQAEVARRLGWSRAYVSVLRRRLVRAGMLEP